jgi:hypothetical protein
MAGCCRPVAVRLVVVAHLDLAHRDRADHRQVHLVCLGQEWRQQTRLVQAWVVLCRSWLAVLQVSVLGCPRFLVRVVLALDRSSWFLRL